jgi:aminoglycoside 6'-N-acetyltransferase I
VSGAVTVRRLTVADAAGWLEMRAALFPGEDRVELAAEIGPMLADDRQAAFAAVTADGTFVGFIEVGERSFAEGCLTSPVAYVEALWVDEGMRRRGVARALVEASKAWARDMGYRELGSDARIDNTVSHEAHRRMGFEETERIVTFRMTLE